MWIKMTTTHAGRAGVFAKDLKYDLPLATLKQLPRSSYRRCPAPWNAAKEADEKQAGQAKAAKTPKDKQVRRKKPDKKYKSK